MKMGRRTVSALRPCEFDEAAHLWLDFIYGTGLMVIGVLRCFAPELGFSFCPKIAPKQLWDCVHVKVACLTSIARCFLRNKLISCDCRRVNRAVRNETRCSKKKRVPICGNSIPWVQVNLNYHKEFLTSWLELLKVSFFSVQTFWPLQF